MILFDDDQFDKAFLLKRKQGITEAKKEKAERKAAEKVAEAEEAAEKAGIERKPVCADFGTPLAEGVKFCSECGKAISPKVSAYSISKFKKQLCMDCQRQSKAA